MFSRISRIARRCTFALAILALCGELPAQDESAADEARIAAAKAALDRVAADAKLRRANGRRVSEGIQVRRKFNVGTADPIYRRGVAFHEEWTIRAGISKLRVPAYNGWEAAKASSEFYAMQSSSGRPGEHLALPLLNSGFTRATRSKFVNFFGLIWVPQEHAFTSMTSEGFLPIKQSIRDWIVQDRKRRVDRDDFLSFDDYLEFKKGNDEEVNESLFGYWFKAQEEDDLVTYFATSEFVYQGRREEIRQPMIQTMTYALVEGKLLRFDFKRLSLSAEDAVQLINFARTFVEDMRMVNGPSERIIR